MRPQAALSFLRRLSLVIICLLIAPVVEAAVKVKGMLVTNEGNTSREFSRGTEYVDVQYFGETYKMTLPNGYEHGGFTRHIIVDLSYEDVTEGQIRLMEETAKNFEYTRAVLKQRIATLKQILENPPPGPVVEKKPVIPFVTQGDMTFKNVRPGRLKNGVLSFFHDTGVFSTIVQPFTLKTLRSLGDLNPELGANQEFKQLLSTYVPVLYFDGKDRKGAKVLSLTATEARLQTDDGVETLPPAKIPAYAWKMLDAAKQNERTMVEEISNRLRIEAEERARAAEKLKEQQQLAQREQQKMQQQQRDRKNADLLKTAGVVITAAAVAYCIYKFAQSGSSGLSAPAPRYGESATQQFFSSQWSNWDKEAEAKRNESALERQRDATKRDNDYYENKAIQNNNQYYEDRQKKETDAYFDRRKETQGF